MADYKRIPNLEIANARLIFRNFSGKPDEFNKNGERKFGVIIDPEKVDELRADGWNIKNTKPNEDGEVLYYLIVKVQYNEFRHPNVFLITNERKLNLEEYNVGQIDTSDLIEVNLVIQPYYWEVNGKSGIKAYLKTGYFEIQSDSFAEKYQDIPF